MTMMLANFVIWTVKHAVSLDSVILVQRDLFSEKSVVSIVPKTSLLMEISALTVIQNMNTAIHAINMSV